MFEWLFGRKKKEDNNPKQETGKVPWYAIPGTFGIKEHHEHKSEKRSETNYSGEDADAWLANVKKRTGR